jgi:hypothetical protein
MAILFPDDQSAVRTIAACSSQPLSVLEADEDD